MRTAIQSTGNQGIQAVWYFNFYQLQDVGQLTQTWSKDHLRSKNKTLLDHLLRPGELCQLGSLQLSSFRWVTCAITCCFFYQELCHILISACSCQETLFFHIIRMFNFGIGESGWSQHSSTPKFAWTPPSPSNTYDLFAYRVKSELFYPHLGRASCYRPLMTRQILRSGAIPQWSWCRIWSTNLMGSGWRTWEC